MKIKRLLCSTVLLLAAIGGPASADIVYNFSGVTFSDGGTLTGTFTTNDAITSLLDYDITTSGGTLAGFEYTPGPTTSFSSLPSILVVETPSLDHLLQVTFASLTSTGSPITIGMFDSFEEDPSTAHREITAGDVVAAAPSSGVPEPITLSVFGAGMAGAVAFTRRRRKA